MTQKESPNSLRRRTIALEHEVSDYLGARDAGKPTTWKGGPPTTLEEKKIAETDQSYRDETQRFYLARYAGRIEAIVQEYKAKGVDTRYFDGNTIQGYPYFYALGSPVTAMCDDLLCRLRELTYHIDIYDNRIDIP